MRANCQARSTTDSLEQTKLEKPKDNVDSSVCQLVVHYFSKSSQENICIAMRFFFLFFFSSEPLCWLHFEADKNPIQALRNSRCHPQRKPEASSRQVHPDAPFICP